MAHAIDDLNGFLDAVLAREGLTADRMVVVGFSQRTMIALHVRLPRDQGGAGIVGFSGRLLGPEGLAETTLRPPVLLLHGDDEQMVPHADIGLAERALTAAGFEVASHT